MDGKEWEVTCVSMGNPHAIVFVPDVAALDLPALGPQFETHPSFPAKINTEFVQVGACCPQYCRSFAHSYTT